MALDPEGRFSRHHSEYPPVETWHPSLRNDVTGGETQVGRDLANGVRYTRPDDPIHTLARAALHDGDAHAYAALVDAVREAGLTPGEDAYSVARLRAQLLAAGLTGRQIDRALTKIGDGVGVDHVLEHGYTVRKGGVVIPLKPGSRRRRYARDYAAALGAVA